MPTPTTTPKHPAWKCGHFWLESASIKRAMCGSCCTREYQRTHHNVTCALCGGGMHRSPRQISRGMRNFCSIACRNRFYKPPTKPRKCIRCEAKYIPTHSEQKYCGVKCTGEAQRMAAPYPCERCGVMAYRHPWQLARYKSHYCGNECASLAKVKGPNTHCDVCAKPIYRKPKQLRMHAKHYCGAKCMGFDRRKDARTNLPTAA